MKDRRIGIGCMALAAFALLAGCEPPESPSRSTTESSAADIQAWTGETGNLQGRVCWVGELPQVSPLQVRGNPLAPSTHARRAQVPNPNAPRIDPATRGIAEAFVFVEGLADAASSWSHPPVQVEMRDRQFQVVQGERRGRLGLVQRGDVVEFRSRDPLYHSVRVRGASFLSIALPDPDQPVKVRLERAGIVELTSGAGHYWMRAYLLVSDHSACAVTEAQGQFTISQVPAGERELTCWLPDWAVARQERDPETGVTTRLDFRPGRRAAESRMIRPGTTVGIDFTFGPSPQDVDAR